MKDFLNPDDLDVDPMLYEFTDGPWAYQVDDECSEPGEVYKLGHWAVNLSTGERKAIDFTPYSRIRPMTFRKIIDLGFPARLGIAPLDADKVDFLWALHASAKGNIAVADEPEDRHYRVTIYGRTAVVYAYHDEEDRPIVAALANGAAHGMAHMASRASGA